MCWKLEIVGCGIDTLVVNVYYADKQFQSVKQKLAQELQCTLPESKVVGNKKKAETLRDGELALQADLDVSKDVFSKKLYFWFSYRARL